MGQLSREARARLRGLTKDNAERVGLHLVMAGRLLDVDPERAYEHAQAAVRRGGRIDVVREAAGIAAYRTGRFADALRELRTVRRLNGSSEHLPIMADAERGLGRPERALALASSEEAGTLDAEGRTELAIVASGARSDLGEHDAAIAVLDRIPAAERQGDLGLRVLQARAVALEAAGRADEAEAVLAGVAPDALERVSGVLPEDDDVVVYDVYDEAADEDDAEVTDDGAVDDGAGADDVDESDGEVTGVDATDESDGEVTGVDATDESDGEVTGVDATDESDGEVTGVDATDESDDEVTGVDATDESDDEVTGVDAADESDDERATGDGAADLPADGDAPVGTGAGHEADDEEREDALDTARDTDAPETGGAEERA
ncbi:hypothetical protein GCM10009809_41150 [Isoptericola hypogeus]|uniref:Tetratricopeptide repeat-containing protein n=1 Tax=Isoptericola hypogeus TaxID=300179 RepID=A0ABN2JYG5_9MICO